MNNEELLNSIIKKYELADPVPADVRAFMEKSRREGLVKILKQEAPRVLFVTAAVSIFLWLKKFGISLSIFKSTLAVSAAIAVGAGAVTVAGVYSTVKITQQLSSIHNEPGSGTRIEQAPVIEQPPLTIEAITIPEIITYTVAVAHVEMENDDSDALKKYTSMVISELRKAGGEEAAIGIDKLDSTHKSDRILALSIIKLNDNLVSSYRISAKVIDSSNSEVLKHVSETVGSKGDIPDSLRSLALKVSAGL